MRTLSRFTTPGGTIFRTGLFALTVSAAAPFAVNPAPAQETTTTTTAAEDTRVWHHGMSLTGPLKYPKDFKRFDWANPDAPKGGSLRRHLIGSFDNLNVFTFKGDTEPFGSFLMQETLMARSLDEPSAQYGLIAESITHPDDYSSATFRLRPEARFHDGKPITPEDVIFSLDALKKAHPTHFGQYWKNVTRAEKTGDHEVTFYFDVKDNRELPHIMGDLFVVPKHFWTGKDKNGKQRDITKTTLEKIIGTGPYRIGELKPGRSITYERIPDYWGKDLPVNVGQWNFDKITIEYYRDHTVSFEAFKSGRLDYFPDSRPKNWVTGYEFGAVKKGLIKKLELRVDGVEYMQAFAFNTRRKKFSDPRVRRAFNLAFDFEWANKNLFYDKMQRLRSYWDQNELGSSQELPKGLELEILETVRADVPPEVFTEVYKNPVNGTPANLRKNLKKATELLNAAGWSTKNIEVKDPDCGFFCGIMKSIGLRSAKTRRVLRHTDGTEMKVEFLLGSPRFEKVVLALIKNLERLGVEATIRVVDSAQYARRIQTFDFDLVPGLFPQSESPGNEQRDFWGSETADREGGRNIIGIKNPAVDKLVKRIIFAKNREELVATTNALDRVLLWNNYVIPHWYKPKTWIAVWDKFGMPDPHPNRAIRGWQTWWYDKAKAAKLAEARQ
ncbi:MAG: extracellular solute-binding protein [Hyphomicrobiaceae bacterium]